MDEASAVPDTSVWRVAGSPLVPPAGAGPAALLAGLTVAVKDLFAVRGFAVGAGNPAFLAEQPLQTRNAWAVQALLDAGASIAGIAQTDEFAYSVAGRNVHYGSPPNVAVPGAVSGGSTSGPATAVAMGQADIGLGTDTGGSLRVPASYQGLWGLRTTHGDVPVDGLLPLAPSFDTIGWITRDPGTLLAAAEVSLADAPQKDVSGDFVIVPSAMRWASEEVRVAFDAVLASLISTGTVPASSIGEIDPGELSEWFDAFRVAQSAEAWQSDGEWVTGHPGSLAADIASRFATAAALDPEDVRRARDFIDHARARIHELLDDRVLLLPSAEGAAPAVDAPDELIDAVRRNTLTLTSVAGIGGLPALSVPVMTVESPLGTAPVGLCLVGPRHSDLALIRLGARLADALAAVSP